MRVFGYGRDTLDHKSLNPRQQRFLCSSYFDCLACLDPSLEWAGWFLEEEQVDLSSLITRPIGFKVFLAMRRGDLLVATNYHVLFKDSYDVANTVPMMDEKGVGTVVLDWGIDTSTMAGHKMWESIQVITKLDREWRNSQQRIQKLLAARGVRLISRRAPIGWTRGPTHKIGRKRPLVPCVKDRETCKEFVRLMHEGGLPIEMAARKMNKAGKYLRGRLFPTAQPRIWQVYCMTVCGFPKIYDFTPPKHEFIAFLAAHDGRPPLLSPLTAYGRRLCTLPPMPDPLPVFVPRRYFAHLVPSASAQADPQSSS